MFKKLPSLKPRPRHRHDKRREISPLLLYLIGTSILTLLLLPLLLLITGLTLNSLFLATAIGFGLPWFGYFSWRLSKYTSIRNPNAIIAGYFLHLLALTTYVLLMSIFWSIALALGYQCNVDINDGSEN